MAKKLICKSCGSTKNPKTFTKGSLIIELFMWLMFIIPGIIYSLWRITSGRYRGCVDCESPDLIPIDSPAGIKLFDEYYPGNKNQTSST
jgi:hypothetical protein